jgi:hypothetical protein
MSCSVVFLMLEHASTDMLGCPYRLAVGLTTRVPPAVQPATLSPDGVPGRRVRASILEI